MIHKLPKWVEVGGFFLALTAGFVNAVGLMGFRHQAVSHLTGTSTFLSLEIANLNISEVIHLLIVMASFVVGAACSGLIIGHTALKLGRRYSVALIIESMLLIFAMLLLNAGSHSGHFLASAACGLQNAITSTYSGAVVRTTHVSGLFTDLGITLGLRLRGHEIDKRKAILYLILIVGFILGGIFGALAYIRFQFSALLIPSVLVLLIATAYWLYLHRNNKNQPNKN